MNKYKLTLISFAVFMPFLPYWFSIIFLSFLVIKNYYRTAIILALFVDALIIPHNAFPLYLEYQISLGTILFSLIFMWISKYIIFD